MNNVSKVISCRHPTDNVGRYHHPRSQHICDICHGHAAFPACGRCWRFEEGFAAAGKLKEVHCWLYGRVRVLPMQRCRVGEQRAGLVQMIMLGGWTEQDTFSKDSQSKLEEGCTYRGRGAPPLVFV